MDVIEGVTVAVVVTMLAVMGWKEWEVETESGNEKLNTEAFTDSIKFIYIDGTWLATI